MCLNEGKHKMVWKDRKPISNTKWLSNRGKESLMHVDRTGLPLFTYMGRMCLRNGQVKLCGKSHWCNETSEYDLHSKQHKANTQCCVRPAMRRNLIVCVLVLRVLGLTSATISSWAK